MRNPIYSRRSRVTRGESRARQKTKHDLSRPWGGKACIARRVQHPRAIAGRRHSATVSVAAVHLSARVHGLCAVCVDRVSSARSSRSGSETAKRVPYVLDARLVGSSDDFLVPPHPGSRSMCLTGSARRGGHVRRSGLLRKCRHP